MGPFPVKMKVNTAAYKITLPDSFCIHPVFHVSLVKSLVADPFLGRTPPPPAPILGDGYEEFKVEDILDSRHHQGSLQFQWKDYGVEENSWKPAHSCSRSCSSVFF